MIRLTCSVFDFNLFLVKLYSEKQNAIHGIVEPHTAMCVKTPIKINETEGRDALLLKTSKHNNL